VLDWIISWFAELKLLCAAGVKRGLKLRYGGLAYLPHVVAARVGSVD